MPHSSKINAQSIHSALGDQPLVTRFAPSPTGYLHLGHVVNAIWVWGVARGLGGKVILRMEDHDRTRCKPEFEAGILEVLDWLGLEPDRGLAAEFRGGATAFRQSDCGEVYRKALADLLAKGLVYACDCSRKSLRDRGGVSPTGEMCYDGHCRDRGLPLEGAVSLRLKLPEAVVEFEDLALGMQTQHPAAQCGDLVLRDRNGNWTYQFAVVVDDLAQGVNCIVRGVDILSSTGRQQLLAQALGKTLDAQYLHHGLLVDGEGRKLSKRDFVADVHARMRAGEAAEVVLGEAAWRAGLLPALRSVGVEELPDLVLA